MPGQEEIAAVLAGDARGSRGTVVQSRLERVPGRIVLVHLGTLPEHVECVDVAVQFRVGEGVDVVVADANGLRLAVAHDGLLGSST
ncbi:hypothetical protein [Streptomyces griseocarneus]|uniref:hypothetical protein n=1 Tax=Streptomyces griseocarneus TaxID=51201 RepID=UPI001E409D6A|nr:hypothetical protein [Streptomyces griseocarneus]